MGQPKALLTFRGETFLWRLQRIFLPHCSPVVVVLGHDAALVRTALDPRVVEALNDDPERGMLSSLQVGLAGFHCGAEMSLGGALVPTKLISAPIALQQLTDARSGAKAPRKLKLAPPGQVHVPMARAPGLPPKLAPQRVLFLPLDYPAIDPDTLSALCAAPFADVTMPRYQGRRGHPVLISWKVAQELLELPVTGAARDVIRRYNDTVHYVDVKDPAILMDVDTPEDYEVLSRL